MKKLLEMIKSLWNVYGGIALSSVIAWALDFSKGSMDKATSFLVLTLTCISLLTFFKITIFKKKPNVVDMASMNQSSIKAMKTAVNPMETGSEIGETIVGTVKKIKKGRKSKVEWFKKNKGALLTGFCGVLTLIGTVCSYAIESFGAIVIVNGYNVIGIVGVVCTTLSGLLSSPITSAKLQSAYDDIKNAFKQEKVEQKETKIALKEEKLAEKERCREQLAELEQEYANTKAVVDEYAKVINHYELLSKVKDYAIPQTLVLKYNEARANYETKNAQLNSLENAIKALKEQL